MFHDISSRYLSRPHLLALVGLLLSLVRPVCGQATAPSEVRLGSVVVRRTAAGTTIRDSVTTTADGVTEVLRTRQSNTGAMPTREYVILQRGRNGLFERTSSTGFLVQPAPARRQGAVYECGYAGEAIQRCTELSEERVVTPVGTLQTRHVLVATPVDGTTAFRETWIADGIGVVRSRGRSDVGDSDIDIVEIIDPQVAPIARADGPTQRIAALKKRGESHPGVFIEVGGSLGQRRWSIPAVSQNATDEGFGATALIGAFLSSRVAIVIQADAYRTSSAGDMGPSGYIAYPTPRYEEVVFVGPGLRVNAQRARGLFIRAAAGVVHARSRMWSVAGRQAVASADFSGTGYGWSSAIGYDVVASHFVATPFASAFGVRRLDMHKNETGEPGTPGVQQLIVTAGIAFGLR